MDYVGYRGYVGYVGLVDAARLVDSVDSHRIDSQRAGGANERSEQAGADRCRQVQTLEQAGVSVSECEGMR